MKKGREKKWLKVAIYILWLFSMALGGFFVPYFINNISFFRIKTLHIEGLETIPPDVVVEEVGNLKNNWLLINSRVLMKNLNKATGNSVSEVKISRSFSSEGVDLKVNIRERKPIFMVVEDDKISFFDENGIKFHSPYIKAARTVIHTHRIDIVSENFENIKNIVKSIDEDIREIYITKLGTTIYTNKGLKIMLPPPFLLNEKLIHSVTKIYADYNIIGIEVKEIEMNMEGLVVVRGGKKK